MKKHVMCFMLPLAIIILLSGCSYEATFERSVSLEGQSNFRDIGGYQTVDGRTVKTGIVYRSGELHALTDHDVEKLTGDSSSRSGSYPL